MAEVEISTEHDHASDPFGRRVGVMVGAIGIILAVVTIASHRAHTATVIAKTEANDEWTFFQAKKIREHLLDVGAGLATALGGERDNVRDLAKGYLHDRDRYKGEADVIEVEHGLIGRPVALANGDRVGKRRFFPLFGAIAALVGVVVSIVGFMI